MSRGTIGFLCIAGGILAGGVATLVVGFHSGDLKLSGMLPDGATDTPQFRASFVDSSKRSCIQGAKMSAPTASAQKIESYCTCFSEGAVDLLTEDDVKYMIDHIGSVPPTLAPRLQPLIAQCRSQTFGG